MSDTYTLSIYLSSTLDSAGTISVDGEYQSDAEHRVMARLMDIEQRYRRMLDASYAGLAGRIRYVLYAHARASLHIHLMHLFSMLFREPLIDVRLTQDTPQRQLQALVYYLHDVISFESLLRDARN